ncbi:hypothetical protein ASZ90_005816 [hydrocarbon metagenome]|uniref:Uncharacterized protein n=1 Tax=hydrocarbon metagenome TaxID=938273 RepID=A0A0W8FTV7_9ZZZZ
MPARKSILPGLKEKLMYHSFFCLSFQGKAVTAFPFFR